MALKTRHIYQNMNQIKKTLFEDKFKEAFSKIRWEKNSFVTHHQDINPDDVINKTSTDKFPANSATVRFQNMGKKIVSVYFYGKEKTRSWGNGPNATRYTHIDKKLRVFLPHKGHNNYNATYSFNGELPDNFDLEQMSAVLEYVSNIVNS